MSQLKLTSCLAKWTLGAWGIQASQPLDRFHPSGWQIPATQLWAPIPGTCHTDESVQEDIKGTKREWGNAKHNRFKLLRSNAAAIKTAQEKDSTILAV